MTTTTQDAFGKNSEEYKETGGDSLEMPEKEMSYSLIGQSFLQEKTD